MWFIYIYILSTKKYTILYLYYAYIIIPIFMWFHRLTVAFLLKKKSHPHGLSLRSSGPTVQSSPPESLPPSTLHWNHMRKSAVPMTADSPNFVAKAVTGRDFWLAKCSTMCVVLFVVRTCLAGEKKTDKATNLRPIVRKWTSPGKDNDQILWLSYHWFKNGFQSHPKLGFQHLTCRSMLWRDLAGIQRPTGGKKRRDEEMWWNDAMIL